MSCPRRSSSIMTLKARIIWLDRRPQQTDPADGSIVHKQGVHLGMPLTFDTLSASTVGTRFAKLREAQAAALQTYVDSAHAWPDVAIELPTGSGKTLIALLVLEYWRKEGKRVAILTGNKTLARQIEAEAKDLRVPTVRFE